MCLLVLLVGFLLLFKHFPEFEREKYFVLLTLLLLFQLYHRGVGSALKALNSVFLSYFALSEDMTFPESSR